MGHLSFKLTSLHGGWVRVTVARVRMEDPGAEVPHKRAISCAGGPFAPATYRQGQENKHFEWEESRWAGGGSWVKKSTVIFSAVW